MALPEASPARRDRPTGHRAGHRAWTHWIRPVLSIGLLAILVTKIDPGSLFPRDRSLPGTLAFFLAGLALMGLSFVLAAWRWQRVLAVFDAKVPLRRLCSHYLAGQFVGNVLPSTVGGDVLRVSRSTKDTDSAEVAFASVIIERLTGFFALPVLIIAGFVARRDLLEHGRSWLALVIAGVTLAFLGVVLALAAHPQAAGRFKDHENWMRYIGVVHVGIDRLRRDPRDAAWAFGAAIAYQLSVIAAVYCAVHTIGISVPNGAVLAFVPAVAIAQVLPISLGGLGIREGALALLLHPLGVATGRAVAVGLVWYAMTLLVSLIGAPAFAVGGRPTHVGRHHRAVSSEGS